MSGRLERSRTNRVIGGVCGGLAEYLDIDATIVRIGMVILGVGGIGILIYFVLLVLMPNPGEPAPFVTSSSGYAAGSQPVAPAVPPRVVDPAAADRRRASFGFLLLAIGIIFLMGNVGLFRLIDLRAIWPLVLIAIGVFFIAQRSRS